MGAGILEAYARAGATCLVNYFEEGSGQNRRDAEQTTEQLRQHQVPVHIFECDVRKNESVQAMMIAIRKTVGDLDILVNNAGICRDKTIKKMTLEEWDSVIDTNLGGVFHCCKHGSEILRDGGRIVSISSVSGLIGIHGQANYSSAKAGVIALTKVLAKELAKRRITVNAVAPGLIQTPMLGAIKPEVQAEYEKQIPLGRIGTPVDVANAVLFLSSEESEYITGQTIPITGGWLA
jgi:3-oxoacyl-[acyl-carrier protein] reductase